MAELIIFTGNIGCGKSLIASKLAKDGYVIINSDSITTSLQGGEYGLYDPLKKPIYQGIENTAIEIALSEGFSVGVDRTCMKKSDRKRYIDVGDKYGAKIISFDWGPGTDEGLNRRLSNPNGVSASTWRSVYAGMLSSYEAPSIDEGFVEFRKGSEKFRFYAFDFDGTIVENTFPAIGDRIEERISQMKLLWSNLTNILIIWTCRAGNPLNEMNQFLLKEKIPFDFINENPLVYFGSPKVYAHEYCDDRNAII